MNISLLLRIEDFILKIFTGFGNISLSRKAKLLETSMTTTQLKIHLQEKSNHEAVNSPIYWERSPSFQG